MQSATAQLGTPTEPWRLELLGMAVLRGPNGIVRLPRNTCGVLAYLALEGVTPKYRLASWLWPDSSEDSVKANMRKLLQRLRSSAGAELIVGDERIALREDVIVDAVQLSALSFAGEYAAVTRMEGRLLDGLEFDDCPGFQEWLLAARESLDALRRDAAIMESDRLERHGKYAEALGFARRALEFEVVSEEAHRRVMRLHALNGDRGAALAAFERCKDILKREFGAEPLPETLELARMIASGGVVQGSSSPDKPKLSNNTVQHGVHLKNPVPHGREREWAALETAYQQGKLAFLRGEPGVGKTRLALDFAASKGRVVLLSPRPGDANVPFSTYARSIREMLQREPDLQDRIAPWVRQELSRLLPELSEGHAPPPLASEADKLRLFEAFTQFSLLTTQPGSVIVGDDAQYMDAATIEANVYQLSKFGSVGQGSTIPFTIEIYRRGELAPDIERNVVNRLVESGMAVLIDVEPLEPDGVARLLEATEPGLGELAAQMTRFTGGNPLFILETVRHLRETGQLERGLPSRLPPPGKVASVINQRLSRLSSAALRVAQAAAVLQSDFNPELIADVLKTDVLELLETWQELESHQVLRGNGFAHDLILETMRAGLSDAVSSVLNRRAAEVLTARGGNPGRIAQHWLDAGAEREAASALLEAAAQADLASRLDEALAFARRAAEIHARHGDAEREFHARTEEARFLHGTGDNTQLGQVSAMLLERAVTPVQRLRAHNHRTWFLMRDGQLEAALDTVQRGLQYASEDDDLFTHTEMRQIEAQLLARLGRLTEAAQSLTRMRALAERLNNPEANIAAINEQGKLAAANDQYHEALAFHHEALEAIRRWGKMGYAQLGVLSECAAAELSLGRPRDALRTIQEAWRLEEDYGIGQHIRASLLLTEAVAHNMLGHLGRALELRERVIELEPDGLWNARARVARARSLINLGALEAAESEAKALLQHPLHAIIRGQVLSVLADALERSGKPDEHVRGEAEHLAEQTNRQVAQIQTVQARALRAPPAEALELARRALEVWQRHDMCASEAETRLICANALLALGRATEALEQVQHSLDLCNALGLDRLEALWLRYQTALALGEPDARSWLEQTHAALLTTVRDHVPGTYRAVFLARPRNVAILEAARRASLPDDLASIT